MLGNDDRLELGGRSDKTEGARESRPEPDVGIEGGLVYGEMDAIGGGKGGPVGPGAYIET